MMPDSESLGLTPSGDGGQAASAVIEAVTCLVCGCLCDDISLVKHGENITAAENACPLGREWLLRDRSDEANGPAALIKGEPAEASEAVDMAAQLLREAKAPIIIGLGRSTNETVAAALELADRIGAVVEPGDGRLSAPRLLAFQRAGRVSASLGEVKNRADVVVFWGADPVVSHPRHWERYSVEPRGRFVPDGRAGRTVIVVDEKRTATAEQADHFLEIDASRQFELLWVFRALVRGVDLDPARVRQLAGVELSRLTELGDRLRAARYGVFFHGSLIAQGTLNEATATLEAAYGLVRDLNRQSRFVILGMGDPGNTPGAESVLTWQTGFPASVDVSAGYPRSLPGVTTVSRRLGCGEADLALIVGSISPEVLDANSRENFEKISKVMIAPPDDTDSWAIEPDVRCFAARPGLGESGTVTRVDGVSLPLRPVQESLHMKEREWLEAISQRMTSFRNACF